jgi:hypothetical protein
VPDVADDWMSSAGPIFNDSVLRGIELAFNDQIEESLVIFERLELTYPDHPAPHFFNSAAYQSYISSSPLNSFQKELEENVQLAIAKGNKLLERKDDPWLHFYVGGAVLLQTELEFSSDCVSYIEGRKTPCRRRGRITRLKKKSRY